MFVTTRTLLPLGYRTVNDALVMAREHYMPEWRSERVH